MAHHFGVSGGLLGTRQRAAKAAPSVAKLHPSVSACKSERASTVTYQGSGEGGVGAASLLIGQELRTFRWRWKERDRKRRGDCNRK